MKAEMDIEIEEPKRKPGRPRADSGDMAGMSIADLVDALRAATGNDDDSLQRRAKYEAEAHARLTRRENERHPGISVYSNPKGDLADPKPNLKCKMFWVGYPLEKDTLTPDEVTWLNHVEQAGTEAAPLEVPFTRTDGSTDTMCIWGEKDTHGQWQRLLFNFKCQGQHKHNLPSMVAMLREVLGQRDSLDDLRAELGRLRAQVAQTAH